MSNTADGNSSQTTVRLQNIAQSYGQSAALMSAVELGVFTAVSQGAGTFDEVANAADAGPHGAIQGWELDAYRVAHVDFAQVAFAHISLNVHLVQVYQSEGWHGG